MGKKNYFDKTGVWNQSKKLNKALIKVDHWLRSQGKEIEFNHQKALSEASKILGLPVKYGELSSVGALLTGYKQVLGIIAPPVKPKKPKKTADTNQTRSFYQSFQWRKLRYEILMRHGFRCMACGRSAKDGVVIHVDHIKPLKYNWHLRLDPKNLQVLCDWCNHGKGNWDETDFRCEAPVCDP